MLAFYTDWPTSSRITLFGAIAYLSAFRGWGTT
jgi:hypothetical protein